MLQAKERKATFFRSLHRDPRRQRVGTWKLGDLLKINELKYK
jgi:hypothetical protein